MTSQPPPAPDEVRSAGAYLRPLRDIAAYVLLAATAVFLFVAVIRLIPSRVGLDFGSRAQDSFYSYVSVPTIAFPLTSVLLSLLIQPRHPRARLITLVALAEYAVAAVFAVIFGVLIGLIKVGSFSGRMAFEELLVRAAWLAVFAVPAYATYQIWRHLFYTPRPKPQPGVYGQPQYGVPGTYPGQPGHGQPGQTWGPPGYGQPGPAYPGTPKAAPPVWGQAPAPGEPAATQPVTTQQPTGEPAVAATQPMPRTAPASGPPLASAQSGSTRPASAQPGSAQPGSAQPGSAQPGSAQPGSAQPGSAQPGIAEPGSAQPSWAKSPSAQSASAQSASAQPTSAQPSRGRPGHAPAGSASDYDPLTEPTVVVPHHDSATTATDHDTPRH